MVGVCDQIAMVEVELNKGISEGLLIAFSICTTLVVAVHLLALMISTCILPNIEAVSNIHNFSAVQESPHDRMRCYVEMAWISSTGIGILLFLIQMAILAWVRFDNHTHSASIVSTVIIVPALIIFVVFAVTFYRQLVAHKVERSAKGLEEIETMANQLDVGLRGSNNAIQTV